MLAIHPSPSPSHPKPLTPNLLPCAIKHTGPIPLHPRHWSLTPDNKVSKPKTSTAYFRGRKLRGRHVVLPAGYRGVVLQKTDKILPVEKRTVREGEGLSMAEKLRRMEEGDDLFNDHEEEEGGVGDQEGDVEVKIMEEMGKFDEVVVWGHESVPEDEDGFVKGVEEWIGFAEAMHSYTDKTTT